MTTKTMLGTWLREATRKLALEDLGDARREARCLAAGVLDVPTAALMGLSDRALAPIETARLENALARRLCREPVSRIVGSRGFWSFELALCPETLDPRPETETLVEVGLDALSDRPGPVRILDVGTGTGCLLLALLSERSDAVGLGIDISEGAARQAQENARRLKLSDRAAFMVGDTLEAIGSGWDLIVSNPPYICSGDIDALEPEVRDHDPRRALDGGEDGLDFYRRLAPMSATRLGRRGVVAFEVGAGQADAVGALLLNAGFESIGFRRDLGDIKRCVTGRRPKRLSVPEGSGTRVRPEGDASLPVTHI